MTDESSSTGSAAQRNRQLSMDEAWDNLCINPHQLEHEEGRRQGRDDGLQAGFRQGFRLGQTTALEYGMEIGFIHGVLTALEHNNDEQQQTSTADEKTQRIQRSLISLRNALEEFPGPEEVFHEQATHPGRAAMNDQTNIDNYDSEQYSLPVDDADADSSLDVAGKMQRISARFKLLTVQLGIPNFSLKQVMDKAGHALLDTEMNEKSKPEKKPLEETSSW